jgi:hypothetical protein
VVERPRLALDGAGGGRADLTRRCPHPPLSSGGLLKGEGLGAVQERMAPVPDQPCTLRCMGGRPAGIPGRADAGGTGNPALNSPNACKCRKISVRLM